MKISPVLGSNSPIIISTSVLFPDPDFPIKPTLLPFAISIFILFTAIFLSVP